MDNDANLYVEHSNDMGLQFFTNFQSLFPFGRQVIMLSFKVVDNMPDIDGGHCCRVVTLSPPTSEIGVWFPARLQVGKLEVACCWSVVYSTEP